MISVGCSCWRSAFVRVCLRVCACLSCLSASSVQAGCQSQWSVCLPICLLKVHFSISSVRSPLTVSSSCFGVRSHRCHTAQTDSEQDARCSAPSFCAHTGGQCCNRQLRRDKQASTRTVNMNKNRDALLHPHCRQVNKSPDMSWFIFPWRMDV